MTTFTTVLMLIATVASVGVLTTGIALTFIGQPGLGDALIIAGTIATGVLYRRLTAPVGSEND